MLHLSIAIFSHSLCCIFSSPRPCFIGLATSLHAGELLSRKGLLSRVCLFALVSPRLFQLLVFLRSVPRLFLCLEPLTLSLIDIFLTFILLPGEVEVRLGLLPVSFLLFKVIFSPLFQLLIIQKFSQIAHSVLIVSESQFLRRTL